MNEYYPIPYNNLDTCIDIIFYHTCNNLSLLFKLVTRIHLWKELIVEHSIFILLLSRWQCSIFFNCNFHPLFCSEEVFYPLCDSREVLSYLERAQDRCLSIYRIFLLHVSLGHCGCNWNTLKIMNWDCHSHIEVTENWMYGWLYSNQYKLPCEFLLSLTFFLHFR